MEQIKEIKKTIQENINAYIKSIDCCELCKNKTDRYEEVCFGCCFFYSSYFEIKK